MIVNYIKNQNKVKIDYLNESKEKEEKEYKEVFMEKTLNDYCYNIYDITTRKFIKTIIFNKYDILLITLKQVKNDIDCIDYNFREHTATLTFNNWKQEINLFTIENFSINFNYNILSLANHDCEVIYTNRLDYFKQIILQF